MADLLVRGIEDEIVRALKARAGALGRSAGAEHSAILFDALTRLNKRSFAQVLAAMPHVGLDSDFDRVRTQGEPPRVLD